MVPLSALFKEGEDTWNPIDRQKIRDFMSIVEEARKYQQNA